MTRKRILFAALLLLCCSGVAAQTTREELAACPERTAGIYHSYEYRPGPETPVPAGYKPFYISHYGRHGSRWHASESLYEEPRKLLRKAAGQQALTARGRKMLALVEIIADDARNRYGDLSPRGIEEHRAIAERMFQAYPEVFSTADGRVCRIESRSTLVPRCILSMAAFNERLKELNPAISASRESSERYMDYLSRKEGLNQMRKQTMAVSDSLNRVLVKPERFLGELFSDSGFVNREIGDPQKLMQQFFQLASIQQDVSYLGISLYDYFTDEELYTLWTCENVRRYLTMGPSARFGDPILDDARPLLRNIVETAQEVIEGRSDLSASLRFGHDVNLVPLVALLGVKGASARVWHVDEVCDAWASHYITPMATNAQFIFFRNAAGDVRVRILLNERDAELPLDGGPYYSWERLRSYCAGLYD